MAWRVQEKRGPWQDQEGALHIAPVNNDTAPMEGARSESTEKELRRLETKHNTDMSSVGNYCLWFMHTTYI